MNHAQSIRIIRKTRANYNLISKAWALSRFRPSPLKIKLMRAIKKGTRVLDLGCGNGLMAPEVIRLGGIYTGLDISEKLLNIAKKTFSKEIIAKKMKFVVGDAIRPPFKKDNFDFIFSFAVMHHIPSEDFRLKFLKEIWRVLKPKGKAVIVNWNLLNDWSDKKYNITEQLKKIASELDAGDVSVPWKATKGKIIKRYIHIFLREEILSLARRAGFKKIKLSYHDRFGAMEKNGEEQVLLLQK